MGLPLQLSVFNLKKQMPTTDTEEKIKSAERLVSIRTNTINDQKLPKQSVDEAFEYLRLHADVLGEAAIDKGRLLRKIDRRIMPIMYLIYLFQFLDKFLLNYAIIMGLPEDLELQGQQLNTVASALWWTYLAFSPVVGVLLNKVPIGKWLGGNMLLWGIVISCTAAVKTYPQLIGIRVLMGLFDAGIPPSLMLISSQYYRKDEQAARFAIWFSSVGMGIILGGLISFGFQNVRSSILASWRIMFLVLGLVSLAVGILSLIFMPDTPMQATFLTQAEKTALLHHVSVNKTGISGHKFEWHQVKELFLDPQIWMLAANTAIVSAGTGILNTYGATLIKSFGYDSKEASLLNMPGGAVAMFATLFFAWCVRYHHLQRWAASVIGYVLSLVGACLVAFAPRDNQAAQLGGLWMIAFSLHTVGIKYQWVAANVAGTTKRACATALLSAAFGVGNIISPYAVQPQDAPRFQTGRVVVAASKAAAICILCLLALYYLYSNKRRDRLYGQSRDNSLATAALDVSDQAAPEHTSETWANLTDMERKSFRYVY